MIEQEFYDQQKWRKIHAQADDLISSKDGQIIAAIYHSPLERTRQDRKAFVMMLRDWAATIEVEDGGR